MKKKGFLALCLILIVAAVGWFVFWDGGFQKEAVKGVYNEQIEAVVEDIKRQIFLALDKAEALLKEGLSEEQSAQLRAEYEASVLKAEELIELSNLSTEQKDKFDKLISDINSFYEQGLKPVQKMILQRKTLQMINQLKQRVESDVLGESIDGRWFLERIGIKIHR